VVGSVISSGQRSLLLFLPAADADVEADDAVLIACTDDGKVAIEIVLALDDLLRTLRDVGGVGEGDIVGEFLFDGDLRGVADRIGFGDEALRINFDVAGSEQSLESAADRAVQRLAEDERRGLIGKSTLTGLLLELRRFIAGAPQSEQGNDVGFW